MLHPPQSFPVTAYTLCCAAGSGKGNTLRALEHGRGGLCPWQSPDGLLSTHVGRVEECDTHRLDGHWSAYDCRNNRLAALALELDGFAAAVARAARRHGAHRVGVFVGTSTSGITETEQAYARHAGQASSGPLDGTTHSHAHTHQMASAARFVRERLDLRGPAYVVSTACSSSAKVFASAARLLRAGLIDAAVVGGVDSLCETTLYGFHSLRLVSNAPCRPWDAHRAGINIGEAAGFALLERDSDTAQHALLGYGETSDAYHMSSPEPDGTHAARAMLTALHHAGIDARAIDLVNLHATATPNNDAAEDRALRHVFGDAPPCLVATKGYTGHTLGAAGIVEAVFCLMSLEHAFVPLSLGLSVPDPQLRTTPTRAHTPLRVRYAMNNSLGFGGSNASLIFGARE